MRFGLFPFVWWPLGWGCTGPTAGNGGVVVVATSVPDPPKAALTWSSDTLGVHEQWDLPFLEFVSPEAGADCEAGWAVWLGLPFFVIPAEPLGQTWSVPSFETGSELGVWGPHLNGNGDWYGWRGGTWTFVEWTPRRYEIVLEGGEVCLGLENGVGADLSTCVPDSGTLVYDADDHEEDVPDLVLANSGFTATANLWTDPRTGRPLCTDIVNNPFSGTSGATGE